MVEQFAVHAGFDADDAVVAEAAEAAETSRQQKPPESALASEVQDDEGWHVPQA